LAEAEAAVQRKLDQFGKTNADYELLLSAQKISASLKPRKDKNDLTKLDEDCLRLMTTAKFQTGPHLPTINRVADHQA
jgi:hypothetical protein